MIYFIFLFDQRTPKRAFLPSILPSTRASVFRFGTSDSARKNKGKKHKSTWNFQATNSLESFLNNNKTEQARFPFHKGNRACSVLPSILPSTKADVFKKGWWRKGEKPDVTRCFPKEVQLLSTGRSWTLSTSVYDQYSYLFVIYYKIKSRAAVTALQFSSLAPSFS